MFDYTQYVNPNIGTIGHLLKATEPVVQSPHGGAVIGPVFRPGMKDRYCSDRIFGFTAGCAIVMASNQGNCPDFEKNASLFDHDFESAHPDCYQVLLEDTGIWERHTAWEHHGVLEFTFPDPKNAYVIVYTKNCRRCTVDGTRILLNGGQQFDHEELLGTMLLAPGLVSWEQFELETPNGHDPSLLEPTTALVLKFDRTTVTLPFCVSATGEYDAPIADFDTVRLSCKAAWNAVLGKIRVVGSEERKRVFYTALYRSMCRMHCYSVKGKYLGFDGQVHADEGHRYYCNDGIWDTYRGMHPLQALLEPKVHRDCLESYLRMYRQSGWLPRFPFLDGNIPCMLGHHTVSILAGARARGLELDWELVWEAAHKNATQRTMLPWCDGEAEELTRCYYEKGFFPALEEDEAETCEKAHPFENRQAVAVTIEHSYDDWCMARLAEALGKAEDAAYFQARSENYKKLYDPSIGFFHPRKADGSFTRVYDPKWCGGQGGRMYYAENNAYIYNFAVQHDVSGMIALHGGDKAFSEKLDRLFVEQYDGQLKSVFLKQYPDATGLMGQFCMGNEPSFHIPYLYNYCGQPHKTQRKVRQLLDLWFTDSPLGICGDEDGGAMSAFAVFSCMGFYPVNPASDFYDLTSPSFDRIELDLPGGNTLTIQAQGASGRAKYIQEAHWNGEKLTAAGFTHAQLLRGGTLALTMGERPNPGCFL